MTAGAISMESLLVVQRDHRRTPFMLERRNSGQKLRRLAGPGMTAPASRYSGGSSTFRKEIRGQRRRTVRGPRCLQRRMLLSFGRGLRSMMAFNTGDRPGPADAVCAAVVTDVIKAYLTEFRVFAKHDHVRDGRGRLSMTDDREQVVAADEKSKDNEG